VRPVIQGLKTRSVFSASTVDQMPRHVSCGLMYGGPDLIPVPDLDRTDFMLMLGANPVESNGSLCTAPDFPGRLKAIRARGGEVWVVDPRRTRTAELADRHLAIRPGTDTHLLLGIAHALFESGSVDPGALSEHLDGLDGIEAAVAPYTPERVAARTDIDAGTIRDLARRIGAAKSACVYGRIGVHTATFGTLTSWAADLVCVLTGNFDRPGGLMFPYPAHARPRKAEPGRGFQIGRFKSRVRGLPEVRSELPVATLADEILTPGDGQIRALVTIAGNPALSCPNGGRLEQALADLEFMVSVDPYLNETTRHADVVLPPPSVLERSHYDLAFTGMAVRNYANYSPAIFPTDAPSEPDILSRLGLVLAGQGAGAKADGLQELLLRGLIERETRRAGGPIEGRDADEVRAEVRGDGPAERMLDVMIRTGPYGDGFGAAVDGPKLSMERLEAAPHGVDLGALEPALPAILTTPSGKIELLPEPIVGDLERLMDDLDATAPAGLQLVGRRTVRSNNSWMHNVDVLVRGRDRCTLHVHPDDAARLGLARDGLARITSRVGSVEAPVEITDSVRPGVVSLPHGYGHGQAGSRLAVAAEKPGVNSNVLTDEEKLDVLSGNCVLNAIPVEVEAVVA